jgi:transcriptional regulator with XRE-family HTH domain
MTGAQARDAHQIGVLVREERRRQGLDQRTLALISDVGVSAVHRVEHGEGVRLDTLIKVMSALGLVLEITKRGRAAP